MAHSTLIVVFVENGNLWFFFTDTFETGKYFLAKFKAEGVSTDVYNVLQCLQFTKLHQAGFFLGYLGACNGPVMMHLQWNLQAQM